MAYTSLDFLRIKPTQFARVLQRATVAKIHPNKCLYSRKHERYMDLNEIVVAQSTFEDNYYAHQESRRAVIARTAHDSFHRICIGIWHSVCFCQAFFLHPLILFFRSCFRTPRLGAVDILCETKNVTKMINMDHLKSSMRISKNNMIGPIILGLRQIFGINF